MSKLKLVYGLWAIILIMLIASLIMFSTVKQKKNKPYKSMEESISDISKKYVELHGWYPESGDSTKITFDELKEEDLISDVVIEDTNDKCDGYVLITNDGVINYKTYMKCKNYTTHGYEKD